MKDCFRTCLQCDRIYEIFDIRVSERTQGEIYCKCGKLLIGWDGVVKYDAVLVSGNDKSELPANP